jgi:hypothetical protein
VLEPSTQNHEAPAKHETQALDLKKPLDKENKENISGDTMPKVGSALDMINSASTKKVKTAPSPVTSHNPPVIKDQQNKNKTPVLSSLNTSQDNRHGHVRALSQSSSAKVVI